MLRQGVSTPIPGAGWGPRGSRESVDNIENAIRSDPHAKHLPVVVLTTSKEEQDIIHSYSLGANAYVRKPVDFAQFVEAVRTLGIFWLLLNVSPTDQ